MVEQLLARDPLLTRKEVCFLRGVSRWTRRRWEMEEKPLPFVAGRIKLSVLEQWLEEREARRISGSTNGNTQLSGGFHVNKQCSQ